MSNPIHLEPVTVSNALFTFSEAFDRALASLPCDGLISPKFADFQLRHDAGGPLAVVVPVSVAPGLSVQVIAPFPASSSEEFDTMHQLGNRMTALVGELDAALALRADIEQAARAMFLPEAHDRLLSVRVAPVDLTVRYEGHAVRVNVAGEADEMLRPFRSEWQVWCLDSVEYSFRCFQEEQEELAPLLERVSAVGAVGFVDALALALAERLPGGQRAALRAVSRREDLFWSMESVSRCEKVLLEWNRGVVRGRGRLSEEAVVFGDRLEISAGIDWQAAVDRSLGDYLDLPLLAGYRIGSAEPQPDGRVSIGLRLVRCRSPPMVTCCRPADGRLLQR